MSKVVAEDLGKAALLAVKKDLDFVKKEGLELSELLFVLDDNGRFAVEFEALGHSFHLNYSGLFTFNSENQALHVKGALAEKINDFLIWRLTAIQTLGF